MELFQRRGSVERLAELVAEVELSLTGIASGADVTAARLSMVALSMGKLLGYTDALAYFEPELGRSAAGQARELAIRLETLRSELQSAVTAPPPQL